MDDLEVWLPSVIAIIITFSIMIFMSLFSTMNYDNRQKSIVTATMVNKDIQSHTRMIGKVMQNVKDYYIYLKYEDTETQIESEELYNILEIGQQLTVFKVDCYDKEENLVKTYLEFIKE